MVKMENHGVILTLHDPIDIDHHIRLGWTKVEDEVKVELDPVVVKAMAGLGLDTPDLLAGKSDEEILEVEGIGPAALNKIRDLYPG